MSSEMETPTLVTPDDLYAQARRFDVDLCREPYLLPIMKLAATTPNPPKRQHEDDESGSERYFLDKVKALRQNHQQQASNHQGGSEQASAWMIFEEIVSPKEVKSTSTYYYNFLTKARQDMHPLVPILGENEWAGADDAESMTRAADPQEFDHAATLHKQTSMKNITELEILCFHCWWRETSSLGENRRRLRLYFSIPTRHFQAVLEDSPNVFTISHIANAMTGVPLSAWDLHEGARLTVLGRHTTLRQASLLTRQWLDVHERLLRPVLDQLQKELAKYELRSHGRSSAPVTGRVICADPHRSRCGVSLRQLLDEIAMLQAKLATYRPDLARRLCEPLTNLDTTQ